MKSRTAKRSLTLLLAFSMVFSMLIGLSGTTLAEGEIEITILHTNDVHGRFYQVDSNNAGMIGIDRIAAIKADTPNSILVDAGDALHGMQIAEINKGENAVKLMAAAGYELMTFGNHEFNYGSDRLLELAALAEEEGLGMITANVFVKETGELFLPATSIVEVEGVKVGFFGLTTTDTPIITHPNNVSKLEFKAYQESAEAAIAQLRSEGAQVIVALAHFTEKDIDKLAGALADKPDVIIEGHDHLLGSRVISGVLIAGAGNYQENLGAVTITVDADGKVTDKTASIISKDDATEMTDGDPDVKEMAEAMKADVVEFFSTVVGKSEVALSNARGTEPGVVLGVRNSEQALGNLVADAMRIMGETDVALTNGGGLRATIAVGELTNGSINAVLPFGNMLVIKEATPKALYAILEFGLGELPAANGRFPQISGMSVEYDLGRAAGQRVVSISIGNLVLNRNDDTTIYTLATNDFTAAGGDGYDSIKALKMVKELGSLDTTLIEYITEKLDGTITADDAKIDGRITERAADWAADDLAAAIEAGLVPANLQVFYTAVMTRIEFAQLAVLLYETVTGEEIETGENPFTDTDDVNALKAFAIEVTTGTGDGTTFSPTGTLTRQQAATMLERLAVALGEPLPAEAPVFTDNSAIAIWAINAVGAVQAAEIMQGVSGGRFAPLSSYSRQQSIITILRMFNYVEEVLEDAA